MPTARVTSALAVALRAANHVAKLARVAEHLLEGAALRRLDADQLTFALGWRLAGAWSGGGGAAAPGDGDAVLARCGYAHAFTVAELGALAAGVGRRCGRAISALQPCPHTTLVRCAGN